MLEALERPSWTLNLCLKAYTCTCGHCRDEHVEVVIRETANGMIVDNLQCEARNCSCPRYQSPVAVQVVQAPQ